MFKIQLEKKKQDDRLCMGHFSIWVMQLTEKKPSTLEMMRYVPLEDGHASLQLVVEVFGGWAMKLSMCLQP